MQPHTSTPYHSTFTNPIYTSIIQPASHHCMQQSTARPYTKHVKQDEACRCCQASICMDRWTHKDCCSKKGSTLCILYLRHKPVHKQQLHHPQQPPPYYTTMAVVKHHHGHKGHRVRQTAHVRRDKKPRHSWHQPCRQSLHNQQHAANVRSLSPTAVCTKHTSHHCLDRAKILPPNS